MKANLNLRGFLTRTRMLKSITKTALLLFCTVSFAITTTEKTNLKSAETKKEIQENQISGKITDENGQALLGVNVLVKGTKQGTISDYDGKYSITAPKTATLIFSFVGYETTETPVNGRNVINVKMQTDVSQLGEVLVQGYRSSIVKSIKIKRNANQLIDAVHSEDIGKLPDPNIADALQRVPGIQLTRQDNEGREVNVRGLSSFFTKIVVNGVGIGPGTASDDSDGVDVGLLGADLATSLEVIKSPTAKQIEGGIGGSVNIKTARPLELEKKLITARLRTNYEPLRGALTPDASFQIGNNWNNKFGVIVGFQGNIRKYRRDAYQDDRSGGFRDGIGDHNGDGIEDLYPDKTRTRYNERESESTSFNLSLQWKPISRLNLYFDGILSKKDKLREFGQVEVRWREMVDSGSLVSAKTDENNTVTKAEFSEIAPITRNSVRHDTEWLSIYNLGADFDFSDRFRVKSSFALTNNKVEEITKGDASVDLKPISLGSGKTFGYQFKGGGDVGFSFLNESNFDITNPELYDVTSSNVDSWGFSAGGSFDLYDHEQIAGQLDFTYDIKGNFFENVDFGFRYFTREENRNRPGQTFEGDNQDVISVFRNLSQSPSNYGDLLGIQGFKQFPYPRASKAYKIAESRNLIESAVDRTDRLFEDNYSTNTDSWASYAQVNIKGDFFRGNIGVRVVNTDFESTGVSVVNDRDFSSDIFERAVVTKGNDYLRILPSANVSFNVTDDFMIRAAFARVMKRPRPEDTRAAFNVDGVEFNPSTNEIVPDDDPYEAFNGNPELDPFIADQFDLSFEYYTKGGGIFSAGYFYKDVKDLTAFDTNEREETVEILNPETLRTHTVRATLTSPINIDGTVKGFELGTSQFLSFLPSPFNGFGLQANFTYTDAEDENGDVIGGTSERVYNASLIYEKYGVGVRFAYNFRDAFNNAPNRGIAGRWTDANQRYDLSVTYDISDHLIVTVEGINLTNEGDRSYLDGFKNRLNHYEQNGSRWLAGIRYRF